MKLFASTFSELAAEMNRRYGKGAYHTAALYREVFQKGGTVFADIPEFADAGDLSAQLARDIRLPSIKIGTRQKADGVEKFTSVLADGLVVESVVIPVSGRTTLCVSSQVGCRMGCRFCVTGGMGLVRQLAADEIVRQVYTARFVLGYQIDNVVFMGMGEPLDNFDPLIQAIRVISDQRGLDIACRHITVSTAGHADGILNLATLDLPNLCLAVSLNAADDKLRNRLMPINQKYPLDRLKKSLHAFMSGKKGVIFIEYVLLAGINDSQAHADGLVTYLKGLPVRVNVIAYNPGSSTSYSPPAPERMQRFCDRLVEKQMFVRRRQSRGRRVMAACGQLGALSQPARALEPKYPG